MLLLVSAIASAGPAATIVVDDDDAEFVLSGWAYDDDQADGGYGGHFYWRESSATPQAIGRWTPPIDVTGVFTIGGFVPYSPNATATAAPFTLHAQGETSAGTLDQSVIGGDFHPLFVGAAFKLVAGGDNYVEVSDGSGEGSGVHVGFDAIELVRVGDPGPAGDGDACASPVDCDGSLVCVDDACRPSCVASGCAPGGACDVTTGLCDAWPDPGDTTPPTDTGTPPTSGSTPTAGDDDDEAEEPVIVPPHEAEKGCGCGSSGSGFAFAVTVALAALRRRRPLGGRP